MSYATPYHAERVNANTINQDHETCLGLFYPCQAQIRRLPSQISQHVTRVCMRCMVINLSCLTLEQHSHFDEAERELWCQCAMEH